MWGAVGGLDQVPVGLVHPIHNDGDLHPIRRAAIGMGEAILDGVDRLPNADIVSWQQGVHAVAQGQVPAAMSLHFTSNATFDIGTDLDSPVSLDYFDEAPFKFNGTIGATTITSRFTGIFRDAPSEQARFFTMVRGAK